jgi:glucose-6-phosphate 1-dehydrogenase
MERPDNLILVIFGATGDLTSRMLIPALYSLKILNMMSESCTDRKRKIRADIDEFRKKMEKAIQTFSEEKDLTPESISGFTGTFHYCSVNYSTPVDFDKLKAVIGNICDKCHIRSNIIFYMATPPSLYRVISSNLSAAGLASQEAGFRRFIFEKPFAYDLASSRELNKVFHELIGRSNLQDRSLPQRD